jgi:hypothetical protein
MKTAAAEQATYMRPLVDDPTFNLDDYRLSNAGKEVCPVYDKHGAHAGSCCSTGRRQGEELKELSKLLAS